MTAESEQCKSPTPDLKVYGVGLFWSGSLIRSLPARVRILASALCRSDYRGIVQGNWPGSPGCLSAYTSPLHSEVRSSGGPHGGERSSHQYSPVNMPTTMRKPPTATRANTTRAGG